MELRTAVSADAEKIAALHAESWQRTYRGMMRDSFLDGDVLENRQVEWRQRLSTDPANRLIVIAEEARIPQGFLCVYGDDDPIWGSLIDNLHVRYDTQMQGVGRRLMREAAVWFNLHYPDRGVYLWVMQKNTNAQGFYERLGGTNREAVTRPNTGGGSAHVFRYVWDNPAALLALT
jgi:ribosomal protein S18 acetylase RimI-like enzyme